MSKIFNLEYPAIQKIEIFIPLHCLFESPTIAGLCQHLCQVRRGDILPSITPMNREQSLPLSFAQQRIWFLVQLEETSVTYESHHTKGYTPLWTVRL